MDILSLDWPTIVGYAVGIIGIIVGTYFGLKATKSKQPTYRLESNNIVSDFDSKVKSIQILKEGRPISNLSVTRILFWNAGREEIRAEDIASEDPIRFNVSNGNEILEFKVLKVTGDVYKFEPFLADKKSLEFRFEFLPKNQGAAIQVFHTSTDSRNIQVKGTLKTGQAPKPNRGSRMAMFMANSKKPRLASLTPLIFGLVFLILGVLVSFLVILFPVTSVPSSTVPTTPAQASSTSGFTSAILLILSVPMSLYMIFIYFRERLPPGLKEFYTMGDSE